MKYKNFVDFHVHTDNSPDAQHSTALMCEKAIAAGVRALAITDHCECDAYKKDKYDLSLRQSVFSTRKNAGIFYGDIVICEGIELGQPLRKGTNAADDAIKIPKDFILASNHICESINDDFYFADFPALGVDCDKIFDEYLQENIKIAKWGKFDSFAHLTYPLRYIIGKYNMPFSLEKHFDLIDEFLKIIISNGKALEINSRGLRSAYKNVSPEPCIIKRYKELGGELITVGSDAHSCDEVGAGIETAMELAFEAGLRYIAIYQNHEAVMLPIE